MKVPCSVHNQWQWAAEGAFTATWNILDSWESEGKGRKSPKWNKKLLSSLTMSRTFIHLLSLTTHPSLSILIFLLLSTSHISQYYSSGHKWANDRVVFGFLILAGEIMIRTHPSEPLNSSSNFSVQFHAQKKVELVDYKEFRKKKLQMFILKLKL